VFIDTTTRQLKDKDRKALRDRQIRRDEQLKTYKIGIFRAKGTRLIIQMQDFGAIEAIEFR
jgi:hypothetical protein